MIGERFDGSISHTPWSAYNGEKICLTQRKSATRSIRVTMPVGAPLKTALDAAAKTKKGPLILVNSDGKPWTADGFFFPKSEENRP